MDAGARCHSFAAGASDRNVSTPLASRVSAVVYSAAKVGTGAGCVLGRCKRSVILWRSFSSARLVHAAHHTSLARSVGSPQDLYRNLPSGPELDRAVFRQAADAPCRHCACTVYLHQVQQVKLRSRHMCTSCSSCHLFAWVSTSPAACRKHFCCRLCL